MASTNSLSPIYMDLWSDLFSVVIEPALKGRAYDVNQTESLTEKLRDMSADKNLYHFIYDRIVGVLEAHCRAELLPQLLNGKGVDLISHAFYGCIPEIDHIRTRILDFICDLERAYLDMNMSERRLPVLAASVSEVFRKTVYDKISVRLREAAFECITNDFIIKEKETLTDYLAILLFAGDSDSKFFDEEWNAYAFLRLVDRMIYNFSLGRKPLQEFLKCTKNLLTSNKTIFLVSEGEYKRRMKLVLLQIRDEMIFGNDAKEFKMILEDGDGDMLNQIFNVFEYDKELPKSVARQASRIFTELVKAKSFPKERTLNKHWLEKEQIFQRLISMWNKLQKIIERGDMNKQALKETLTTPFLTVINSAFPDPEAMMNGLAKYCEKLFLRICKRQMRLQPEGMRHMKALLALSSLLPSGKAFQEIFRVLLSKILLGGTSQPLRIEQSSGRLSYEGHTDTIHDIFAMLDDVSSWPLYEREIFRRKRPFECKYGRIDLEPKVVCRSRWDLEPDIGLVLPYRIQVLSSIILEYLHAFHPMRRPSIHASAGKMTISADYWTFRGKKVRIELTTGQSCVLTLMEKNNKLTLKNAAKAVLLCDNDKPTGFNVVVAIIKSMMGKHPVLSKRPPNSQFLENDIIGLNKQFQPEAKHIRLPCPDYSEESTKNVQATVSAVVIKCHRVVLEAAVMKILKQERLMALHRLKEMVCSQLGKEGTVNTESFGEVIERLARDEYLAVDKMVVRYLDL